MKTAFVGGPPRSGTTLTHAIICTSADVNNYVAESSFLTPQFRSLIAGINNFSNHTGSFFTSPEEFIAFSKAHLEKILEHIARHVGSPNSLCLKDPLMTGMFDQLAHLFPEYKFVVTARHPYDVLRSRKKVMHKMGREEIGPNQIRFVLREYVNSYAIKPRPNIHFLRYEDLEQAAVQERLSQFLEVAPFDLSQLWVRPGGERVDSAGDSANPWHSPLYGEGIKQSRRNEDIEISAQERQMTRSIAGETADRFGYTLD